MPSTLASALDSARARAFVGREPELEAFDSAMSGHGTQRVLFVHGPGGIGKTTLLQQLRIRAVRRNRSVVELDTRDIDCSPDSFRSAYELAGLAATSDGARASVLLLDGYDRLRPIDDWLRGEFLPSLPADSVVVIVGREPPAPPWRTDPGWRALATVHRLGALDEDESLDLLTRFAVPAAQHPRLAGLGRGHPLTLALLADSAVTAELPRDLADAPDLVALLVTQIVGDAPDEGPRIGLRTVCNGLVDDRGTAHQHRR